MIDTPPNHVTATPPKPVDPNIVTSAASKALGVDLSSAKASAPTIPVGDGFTIPNPLYEAAQKAAELQTKFAAGQITAAQAKEGVIALAVPTAFVAYESYQFFNKETVSAAGLKYLIDSADNPGGLTGTAYSAMNVENRFINFAVNLGNTGVGAQNFAKAYGGLSFDAAVAKLYDDIIGTAAAKAAGYDTAGAQGYIVGNQAYFQALGGGTLQGAETAAAGYLLKVATDAHLGAYYQQAHDLIGAQVNLVGASADTGGLGG